jgi:hypothetical protein
MCRAPPQHHLHPLRNISHATSKRWNGYGHLRPLRPPLRSCSRRPSRSSKTSAPPPQPHVQTLSRKHHVPRRRCSRRSSRRTPSSTSTRSSAPASTAPSPSSRRTTTRSTSPPRRSIILLYAATQTRHLLLRRSPLRHLLPLQLLQRRPRLLRLSVPEMLTPKSAPLTFSHTVTGRRSLHQIYSPPHTPLNSESSRNSPRACILLCRPAS